MSELTVAEIAANESPSVSGHYTLIRVLAREIIALRDGPTHVQLTYLDDRITALATRVQALESQARPFQESGELAVGLNIATVGCTCPWDDAGNPDPPSDSCNIHGSKRLVAERDDELAESRVERNAEIERLREALRKIVDGMSDVRLVPIDGDRAMTSPEWASVILSAYQDALPAAELRARIGQLVYDFDHAMINALAASRVGTKVALPSRLELVDALMNLIGAPK